jgi:hypothetical protein
MLLARPDAEAIVPPIAGEARVLALGGLSIEVQFARPPGLHAIFEFGRRAPKPVSFSGFASDILYGHLQVSRLFHLVRIGDEKGAFAGPSGRQYQTSCRERYEESQGVLSVAMELQYFCRF